MGRRLVISQSLEFTVVGKTANSRPVRRYVDDCRNGAPARTLSLQIDFGAKGDNRGQPPQRQCVCRPYSVATRGSDGMVADSGNNRVLVWHPAPGIAS